MELQNIINKIDIWQEWHDNYCYYVPNSLRVQRLVKVGKNGTRICSMSFLNGEESNVYLPYNKAILQKKNRLR